MKTRSAVRRCVCVLALQERPGTEGFLFYSWDRKETAQTSRSRRGNEEGRGRKQQKRVKTSAAAVIKVKYIISEA